MYLNVYALCTIKHGFSLLYKLHSIITIIAPRGSQRDVVYLG
jgi:hypothetical protein